MTHQIRWSDADLLHMLRMRDDGRSCGRISVAMTARLRLPVTRAAVQGALRRIDYDYARSCGMAPVRRNRRLALGLERRAAIEPLLAQGLSAPQIAERLGLNVNTVKSQCRGIRARLRAEAEARA